MSAPVIHVGGQPLVDVLTTRGWAQGDYEVDGEVCLHGAIRLCQPVPGDAHLIEQVEARLNRWSTSWNDTDTRTEREVLDLARSGWDITDDDLAETFGPQWRAVVALVRRCAVMTADEAGRLRAARGAAGGAAGGAAWNAAWGAAGGAARGAADDAARDAARGAADDAARGTALGTARDAAWDAALAVVTWDLATADGPYTTAHRDLLIAPWREVIGDPTDLVEVES